MLPVHEEKPVGQRRTEHHPSRIVVIKELQFARDQDPACEESKIEKENQKSFTRAITNPRPNAHPKREKSRPHHQWISEKRHTALRRRTLAIKRVPNRPSHERPILPLTHVRVIAANSKLVIVHFLLERN